MQDDFQVEHWAPVVDVPKIMLDAALHLLDQARFTTITVDLRPTRQAGLDVMPERVIGDQVFIFRVV